MWSVKNTHCFIVFNIMCLCVRCPKMSYLIRTGNLDDMCTKDQCPVCLAQNKICNIEHVNVYVGLLTHDTATYLLKYHCQCDHPMIHVDGVRLHVLNIQCNRNISNLGNKYSILNDRNTLQTLTTVICSYVPITKNTSEGEKSF